MKDNLTGSKGSAFRKMALRKAAPLAPSVTSSNLLLVLLVTAWRFRGSRIAQEL